MPVEYRIEKYDSHYKAQWDSCVAASKNGTFLHYRDFMEYHSDRFEDFSIMVFEGDKTVAVLPANRVSDVVHSHQGLTYGGLVYGPKLKLAGIIKILKQLLEFFNESGIRTIHFKSIPAIYHKQPAQEAEYALFTAGAKLARRDMGFVSDLTAKQISKDKIKRFNSMCAKRTVVVRIDNDFGNFWDTVLTPILTQKYNASPVHSLAEILYLKDKFPDNILQYNAWAGSELVAGLTIFKDGGVIKSQYGAANTTGQQLNALDFLFISVMQAETGANYLDMGTVKVDNAGLAQQKQELGGRLYLQDYYEIETGNFMMLDNVLT